MLRPVIRWLVAAVLALVCLPNEASAQTQIRPRMLILLDTSGSMLFDFGGIACDDDADCGANQFCTSPVGGICLGDTLGDGSADGPWGVGWGTGYPGRDTGVDGDALTDDSRLFIAKSVLTDIFNSTGDIEFALEQYHNTLNPWVPFGNTCPLVIPAYANSLGAIAGGCQYFDAFVGANVRADPISYQGYVTRTLEGVCTPAEEGGDVLVDFQNDNQNELLSWIDGQEDFLADRTDWVDPVFSHEMRASGFTPLARSIQTARTTLEPLYDAEPLQNGRVCRPYYVVIVTDGEDTCENCGCRVNGTTCTANSQCCGNRCRDGGGGTCGVAEACTCQPLVADVCSSTDRQTVPVNRVEELCEINGGVAGDPALCSIKSYVIGLALDSPTLDNMALAGATGFGAFVATNRDELAGAFSEIIEGSVLVEICDGDDNDCDGEVDEGFPLFCNRNAPNNHPAQDLCADPGELECDGQDDNCNGLVDEGFPFFCNRPGGHAAQDLCVNPGETVCDGVDDNCNGVVDEGVCGGCTPEAEVCDGVDNDCDGSIDEGLTRACGTNVGECTAGQETCQAGAWLNCSATGPFVEVCNNLDDDCDGTIDGMSRACGDDTGECVAGSQRCVAGNWNACAGGVGPRAEACDELDNDCDGAIDEGLGGGDCGSEIGDCEPGIYACVDGALVCQDETPGGPEVCDGRDNDCDNLIDEGNPGGGADCGADTDEGECEYGSEVCVDAEIVCVGATGPSADICDGLDNDCDGEIDQGNPGGGADCGDDTGECVAGTTNCVDGELVCEDAVGPVPEECNGLDDDCDGAEDEGLPLGAACGEDTGECEPGVYICFEGELVCDGGISGRDEECNGLDDDCDGFIDEGLGLGEPCSIEEGECDPGQSLCLDGELVCTDGVLPQEEECDCRDNDCDTLIDEGDDLCPPGQACRDCDCVIPCGPDQEFPCPPGRECVHDVPGDQGWCVGDLCSGVNCEAGTRCEGGECVNICQGVVCDPGTRCDDRGRCVADDCFYFPDDCTETEACIGGDCAPHPCAEVVCLAGQYCRDGVCIDSCVDVPCRDGQRCVEGDCEDDLCAAITCGRRTFCDPATGNCTEDLCETENVDCAAGHVCDPFTGECVEDPCNVTECPVDQICRDGICGAGGGGDGDADVDGDDDDDDGPSIGKRVLATGGGGCDCRVAPATGGSQGWLVGLGLFGLGLLARARRRRPFAVAAGAALAIAAVGPGCQVDPYCVDCPNPSPDVPDAATDGPPDITYDASPDAEVDAEVPLDAGPCEVGAAEQCNGLDDDCDGDVDEGIDFAGVAHCGTCEVDCRVPHAIPTCTWSGVQGEAGTCGIFQCDAGFVDLDPLIPGCDYVCTPEADDDTLCNFQDDDCDGFEDEDVAFDDDPLNCGGCGERCSYVHGIGACVDGVCALADCELDYYDHDDDPDTGCEDHCVDPTDEVCNGRDDDCDGTVDDGDPEGGVQCGTDEGECSVGTTACTNGVVTCEDGVEPTTEVCNGRDDDCDGSTDENNPEGGISCGESEGDCVAGTLTCVAGELTCVGAVAEAPEICDGRDNDCDGTPDDGNPGGGGLCGSATGDCDTGTEECRGGQIVCVGAVGPELETCNGDDDDCDGATDEDFDLVNSIANCGGCGVVCSYPNAVPGCSNGVCQMLGCLPQFFDRNVNPADGCEFGPCQLNGNEICNGQDDDCDDATDEGLVPPANFCNANGVCAGTIASCGGAQGWGCNYVGAGYEAGGETLCDALDNDCDGAIDEPFPNKGAACDNGAFGTCRRDGTFVCNAQQNGLRCNAALPPPPGTEICNGLDDDCDNAVDDQIALADMNAVHITSGNPDFWIFEYEASRPDARDDDQGLSNGRACSNPDVLPWTDVTEPEAEAACCALNTGGCDGNPGEWRLCDSSLWELACKGDLDNTYPYGDIYGANTCNGNDWDCDVAAGDQDCLYATGSFGSCIADWGAAGDVFDLSGNVKEWTTTERPAGSGVHEIRGGAYNNAPGGLTCDFDFTLASETFNFQNIGFRCCYYE